MILKGSLYNLNITPGRAHEVQAFGCPFAFAKFRAGDSIESSGQRIKGLKNLLNAESGQFQTIIT